MPPAALSPDALHAERVRSTLLNLADGLEGVLGSLDRLVELAVRRPSAGPDGGAGDRAPR